MPATGQMMASIDARAVNRAAERGEGVRMGRRMTQVLEYVHETLHSAGAPPSYGMICNQLGICSRSNVRHIVARLEQCGALKRSGTGRLRRIRLAS